LWNTIKVCRTFDRLNADYQKENNGINKMISVHGNRFLLHMIFKELKNSYDFTKEYIDIDEKIIKNNSEKYIELLCDAKNNLYPDAYPANIFKNAGRCKELKEFVNDKNDKI
jgi:hypothetical protein